MQDSLIITLPVQDQDVNNPVQIELEEIDSGQSNLSVLDTSIIKIVSREKENTVKKIEIEKIINTDSINKTKLVSEYIDILYWNSSENLSDNLFSKDSLKFQSVNENSILKEESGFTYSNKNKLFANDWAFWLFIITGLLYIWIQLFYSKYLTLLFNSTINYQASSKLYTEKNVLAKRASIVLNFIYTISLGMFIYVIFNQSNMIPFKFDKFTFFLVLLNLIILFSICKIVIHYFAGYIFNKNDLIREFLHNLFIINKSLGIILLPITFIVFYTPDNIAHILIILGIIIICLAVLIKIIRIVEILIQKSIFNFYSILYLCTLEILPILIGYKFLIKFT